MPSVTSVTRLLALVTLLTLFAAPARADDPPEVVVERRQGEPVRGRLVEFDGGRFKVLVGGQVVEIDEDEVREVRFAERPPTATEPRAVHRPAVLTATTAPGAVRLTWRRSNEDAFVVLTRTELWRRVDGGAWTWLATFPGTDQTTSLTDDRLDSRTTYHYKLVTVAALDLADPVVQRFGLDLAEGERRKESAVVGPLTPDASVHVYPSSLRPQGAALVVYAWRDGEWSERPARVAFGERVPGTELTLITGEVRHTPAEGPRLVLTLRRGDGTTFDVDGRDLPAELPAYQRFRGLVLRGQDRADDRDRDAAVRAALQDPRPVSLLLTDASMPEVAARLREVTGVDVAYSPGARDATLTLNVQSVPLREALPLAAELMQVQLVPWCGVLWLQPRGAGAPWSPPAVAGPLAGRLERERVTLDLALPVEDALLALAEATGVSVAVSPAARDALDDEEVAAPVTARDLPLRDALTLLVHGVGLRWHARGSVVLVQTLEERSSRQVAAERVLEALATGDARALGSMTSARDPGALPGRLEAHERARRDVVEVLAGGERTWSLDRVLEGFRFEVRADGQWYLAEPPTAPAPGAILVDATVASGAAGAHVSLEAGLAYPAGQPPRRHVVADLYVEPHDREIQVAPAPGTNAAVAPLARPFAEVTRLPDEVTWEEALDPRHVVSGAAFVVRSASGTDFYKVRLDYVSNETIVLTAVELVPDARPAPAPTLPPTLEVTIDAPGEDEVELTRERVEVTGKVVASFEPEDLEVTVNGAAAAITSGGAYRAEVTLPAGEATIEVVARATHDPGAPSIEGRARRRVIVSLEDERLLAYAFRAGDERRARDGLEGCMPASAQAVRRALAWLLKHQSPDGRWDGDGWSEQCEGAGCRSGGHENADARYDAGLTALAILAFTADGQTHRFGPDRRALAKAVAWLLRQQSTDGSIGVLRGRHDETIYNHALATQALCELAAMSPDDVVRAAARRAVAFCLALQTPGLGWKYGERPGRSDTSVTGVMVQALLAAKTAGIEVPDAAFEGARRWFARTTDANGETGYETPGGGSSYLNPNDGKFDPVPCMTALAVACRLRMGDPRTDRTLRQGRQHLLTSLPERDGPRALRGLNFLYWSYGASAAFQLGGEVWGRWSATLQPALVSRQRTDGCAAGAWDPVDEWSLAGGRVYATAVNALTLQVYHRHERRE